MKVGAMQPYFLPYVGYFSLIKHTDIWVINGVVQFRKHSWINRNRVLSPVNGWNYIRIPLKKHSSHARIEDILICNEQNWKTKIVAQLTHYKKIAPYYNEAIGLTEKILSLHTNSLMEMNVHALSVICQYLNISFKPLYFSQLKVDKTNIQSPDEWGLETTRALEADEYWNLPGGKSFYDPLKYEQHHIKLRFIRANLKQYDQHRVNFEPALSIIDVLMFNTPEEVNEMLDNFQLESISHELQTGEQINKKNLNCQAKGS